MDTKKEQFFSAFPQKEDALKFIPLHIKITCNHSDIKINEGAFDVKIVGGEGFLIHRVGSIGNHLQ